MDLKNDDSLICIDEKSDVEELLLNGRKIQVSIRGFSMYPLFKPGRDAAFIEPIGIRKIKRGDVCLFRRKNSILVLHRVVRVSKDGVFFVGDNQTEIEGPISVNSVKGYLDGGIRNGKTFYANNLLYRFIFGGWLSLRSIRPFFWKISAIYRRNGKSK